MFRNRSGKPDGLSRAALREENSATSSPLSPSPTTTSLLIVLRLQTFGAPEALAIGPMATSKGVLAGAAQS